MSLKFVLLASIALATTAIAQDKTAPVGGDIPAKFVPQDQAGLFRLLGGDAKTV